jgi:hypothetical protein
VIPVLILVAPALFVRLSICFHLRTELRVSSAFRALLAEAFSRTRNPSMTHKPGCSNRMRGSRACFAPVLMMDKTSEGIWAFSVGILTVCASEGLAPLLLKLRRNYWSWNDQVRVRNNNCQNET